MQIPNSNWHCLRHECAFTASEHVDEAGTFLQHAWCPRCFSEIDRMKEELKMYHDMDARIHELQNACIKVLSPEE